MPGQPDLPWHEIKTRHDILGGEPVACQMVEACAIMVVIGLLSISSSCRQFRVSKEIIKLSELEFTNVRCMLRQDKRY